jgi:hypothetical protein
MMPLWLLPLLVSSSISLFSCGYTDMRFDADDIAQTLAIVQSSSVLAACSNGFRHSIEDMSAKSSIKAQQVSGVPAGSVLAIT